MFTLYLTCFINPTPSAMQPFIQLVSLLASFKTIFVMEITSGKPNKEMLKRENTILFHSTVCEQASFIMLNDATLLFASLMHLLMFI